MPCDNLLFICKLEMHKSVCTPEEGSGSVVSATLEIEGSLV